MPEWFDTDVDRSPARGPTSRRLFALLLALTFAVCFAARARAWLAVEAQPEQLFARGVAASGSDSYLWFRLARELRAGGEIGGIDRLRAWPDGIDRKAVPALPWLIAQTARAFETDVYRAGIAWNVALSGLFVLPLGLHLRTAGYPLAGLLGGYVGGLAPAYVERSSVQRVDTDGGTLLFLCLLALAIGALRPTASPRRNTLVAAGAGLVLAAFCRWYGQPWFWLVYLGTLGLHLATSGFGLRASLPLVLAFGLCANPASAIGGAEGLFHFLRFYVMSGATASPGPFDYASITADIAELQALPLRETLARTVAIPAVAGVGLVGFAAFCIVGFRALIPLLPLVLLGLYALIGPERFDLFLAPLVGIGLGFGLHALARAARRSRHDARRFAEPAAQLAAVVGALVLLPHTGFALAPRPTVPVRLVESLQRLRESLPPDPAILASWGAGYLISDVTGAATFNDGEAPDPLVHYLFARAIASSDPRDLPRIVEILSSTSRRALHEALDGQPDPEAAVEALLRREARTAGNVVLVLTERDVVAFPSFFRTGRWRFAEDTGPEDAYYTRTCRRSPRERLRCETEGGSDGVIDLERGRLGDGQRLRRVVELRDGRVVRETEHGATARFSLELVPAGADGTYTAHLVSEPVFRSNFNQLFVLGRFDPDALEELAGTPPTLRAYRIRSTEERR
ncbi:MAG: hypothetical protein IPK00_23580 [Deltaproteobacteria bacterium]|nr:hypothetical protein [Deltaproteobacteria bacterium]